MCLLLPKCRTSILQRIVPVVPFSPKKKTNPNAGKKIGNAKYTAENTRKKKTGINEEKCKNDAGYASENKNSGNRAGLTQE